MASPAVRASSGGGQAGHGLGAVLRLMCTGLSEGITVGDAAAATGMSRSTLERVFRARFGIGPGA